jgi:hypothetical protein
MDRYNIQWTVDIFMTIKSGDLTKNLQECCAARIGLRRQMPSFTALSQKLIMTMMEITVRHDEISQ